MATKTSKIDSSKPVLYRYVDGVALRNATDEELAQSNAEVARGHAEGIITVEIDGKDVDCYVQP